MIELTHLQLYFQEYIWEKSFHIEHNISIFFLIKIQHIRKVCEINKKFNL